MLLETNAFFYRYGGCNKHLLTSTRKIIPLRHIKNRQWVKPKRRKNCGRHNGTVCRIKEWQESIARNELRWCWFSWNMLDEQRYDVKLHVPYRTGKHLIFVVNASGHVGVIHFVIDRRSEYHTKSQCVHKSVLKYNGNDTHHKKQQQHRSQ